MIKDETGKPIGMRGVTFDITDRKEVERRLALLAEISTTGLVTPSFQDLARDIARRTAHVVGDYCIIRMLREGRLEGIAHAHVAARRSQSSGGSPSILMSPRAARSYAEMIARPADPRRQRRSESGRSPTSIGPASKPRSNDIGRGAASFARC